MKRNKVDYRRCFICHVRGDTTTLFRFPANPALRHQWAYFCGIDVSAIQEFKHFLCPKHFTPDQISPKTDFFPKTKLRIDAVPTILGDNPRFDDRDDIVKLRKNSLQCYICRKSTDKSLPLFQFPKTEEVLKKWKEYCKLKADEDATKLRLCSRHFFDDLIMKSFGGRRVLRKDSVPTVEIRSSVPPEESSPEMKPLKNECNGQSPEFVEPIYEAPSVSFDPTTDHDYDFKIVEREIDEPIENLVESRIVQVIPATTPLEAPDESSLNYFIDSDEWEPTSPEEPEPSSLEKLELPLPKQPKPINVVSRTWPSRGRAPVPSVTVVTEPTVRYIGDVTEEHLKSHKGAVKYFFMAKNALDKNRKKMHNLQQQLRRAKTRMKRLEDIIMKERGLLKENQQHILLSDDDDFSWPLDTEEDPLAKPKRLRLSTKNSSE